MELDQKDLIDKYLHGELSGPILEELEEKFFLDDELFQTIESAEMALVDRFVRGDFNAKEKARFEKGYLTSPERRTHAAEAALFHQELAALRREAAPESETDPEPGWLDWFSSLFAGLRMPAFQLATAATALLLAAGLFYVLYQSRAPDIEIAGGNRNMIVPPPVNIRQGNTGQNNNNGPEDSVTLVPKLLATGEPIVPAELETTAVELKKESKFISLRLSVPAEIDGESFSIVVRDSRENEVLKRNYSRRPTEDAEGKFISIGIQTKDLGEGRHSVSVTAADKPERRAVYQFEIKRGE